MPRLPKHVIIALPLLVVLFAPSFAQAQQAGTCPDYSVGKASVKPTLMSNVDVTKLPIESPSTAAMPRLRAPST